LRSKPIRALDLYEQLERDFIFPHLHDEFASHIPDMQPFMTENFKERSMGLVCDFAREIQQVYTAVFPSDQVMVHILTPDSPISGGYSN